MILSSFLVFFSACNGGASEESIKKEFSAYVAGAKACVGDSECQVAFPGCPLGCEVAVRADRVDDVTDKAAALIHQYQSGGHQACAYSCAQSKALCNEGLCALEIDTPVRGGDGGDGADGAAP
jgi:hypothetical protein